MNIHISGQLAKWLAREGTISGKDQHLFSFAIYSFLFGLLPIGVSTAMGLLFGLLKESFLMMLPYMLIRKFSGGFHFKSPYICLIVSILLITMALALVKQLILHGDSSSLPICVLLAVLSLCVNSPVESQAKRLSASEKKIFRIVSIILSVFALIVFFLFQYLYELWIYAPIGVGILLTAVLQIPCIISNVLSRAKLSSLVN